MRFALRLLNNHFMLSNNRPKQTTIYLKHIKWITGKTQLENHFNRYGQIEDISLFFDPTSGLHRGFASITFASSDAAENAMRPGVHYIDGSKVLIDPKKPLEYLKHNKFSSALSNRTATGPSKSEIESANDGKSTQTKMKDALDKIPHV